MRWGKVENHIDLETLQKSKCEDSLATYLRFRPQWGYALFSWPFLCLIWQCRVQDGHQKEMGLSHKSLQLAQGTRQPLPELGLVLWLCCLAPVPCTCPRLVFFLKGWLHIPFWCEELWGSNHSASCQYWRMLLKRISRTMLIFNTFALRQRVPFGCLSGIPRSLLCHLFKTRCNPVALGFSDLPLLILELEPIWMPAHDCTSFRSQNRFRKKSKKLLCKEQLHCLQQCSWHSLIHFAIDTQRLTLLLLCSVFLCC